MTDHAHTWEPIVLVRARYMCTCGEQGRRMRDGSIQPLKRAKHRITLASSDVVSVRTTRDGGIVDRAPMLHEIERRRI